MLIVVVLDFTGRPEDEIEGMGDVVSPLSLEWLFFQKSDGGKTGLG